MKKRNHQESIKMNLQSQEIGMLLEVHRIQKRRARISAILAVIVVFVTVGNLSFPARTLTVTDAVPDYGYTPHQHTDECYQINADGTRELICTLPEIEEQEMHTHGADCYDEDGNLICGLLQLENQQSDSGNMTEVQMAADVNEETGENADVELAGDTEESEAKGDIVVLNKAAAMNRAEAADADNKKESDIITGTVNGYISAGANEIAAVLNSDEASVNEEPADAGTDSGAEMNNENESLNGDAYAEEIITPDQQNRVIGVDSAEAVSDTKSADIAANNPAVAAGPTVSNTETLKSGQQKTEKNSDSWRNRKTIKRWNLTAEADGVRVAVTAAYGAFPEGTTIQVRIVTDKKVMDTVRAAVEKDAEEVEDIEALDISFYNAGKEIEPSLPVHVTMASDKMAKADTPVIVHVNDNQKAEIVTSEADSSEAAANASSAGSAAAKGILRSIEKAVFVLSEDIQANSVSFDADSFSVYALVYTVDFHWDVNGEDFEYSIPGGGFISMRELVEILDLVDTTDTDETPEAAETAEIAKAVSAAAEDLKAKNEAVSHFMKSIEKIDFSNKDLVSVSKVEEDTTVGAIKDRLGLECAYSAELTMKEIAEINAQAVKAGDWALISLEAFDTEETLAVTMKNGAQWTVKVTDAQIVANVLAADGEHFRITVSYDDNAKIPDGSVLEVKEIAEGTEEYQKYLEETADQWDAANREGFISYARFFDLEIQKDGRKIEPEAAVEVKIEHEEGLTRFNDETLSVIHFAEAGTEIIDDLFRNSDSTQVVYEQDSFSVIGTVSSVKESGWPTANGQYAVVLQDGDDYYALKQDGTLAKVRYFNNTVSFIGEGTTTKDYINEYLWYVVSSGTRGKIADEYTEYNAAPDGQTFIDPYYAEILSGTSRQLQIRDGKIWCSGQLPDTAGYTQVTLSASGGQLSRVAMTSVNASPVFFAAASSFTANDNETDLFTQEEVESIVEKWKEQKTQAATYDKTAEVYDYENRVYQIDITASSSDYEVSPSIALEFVVDASRSMFFPTSVTEVGTFNGTNASNVRDWINAHGDKNQVYFVIQDKNGKATQYAIFFDPNSEYTVSERVGWSYRDVKYKGQWLWVDASNYNPPDDKANGGNEDSRKQGSALSSWSAGSFDDGKIYTTEITGASTGTFGTRRTWISRIEYLKQCVRVASQVIYTVDEKAQIGLIGFNANTTDYGTFGKSEQQTLLDKLDNISLAGGTDHQGGLQKAIDKYNKKNNSKYYAEHYAGRKHVVVLVTDGAPNKSGVNWTTIGTVAKTLKGLKDDFGQNTELYTMGLSLSNVGTNQSNLFGISSGAGYTYAGEDAAQIINAVTKMVDGVFVQANLVADVTDVIDPAFYPVDKANGLPLAENDWINLEGRKVNAGAADAKGQIRKDAATGNWYVEWKDQSIDWPTTDSNGAVAEPGWHGTVFVKAKEDFLGGNGITTNAEGSKLEAKAYIVHGETARHNLPAGDHTTTFDTPYVNVDELAITNNETEWTVYLGTNVDPLEELKALWEKVNVREVVTKTGSDHRVSSDGSLTYQYQSDVKDNRDEINGREEFPITDLEGITLTNEDWADLISGKSKVFNYNAYGHEAGTIMISLTQDVAEGEENLEKSPHDTEVTGDEVEKYTLTVSYRPSGANIADWHTGSWGTGMSGSRAGNIIGDNIHIINVYAKGLQITKVDLDDRVLTGAKFALYRTARAGETDLLEINGGQYFKTAEFDASETGVAMKEQIEQLKAGEQYYLVETQVPDGYLGVSPIPVELRMSDVYTQKSGTAAQSTRPESGIYNWEQKSVLILSAETGVKRTDAANTEDLTHSGIPTSDHEVVCYRVINNPGVELPVAGGIGTHLFTISGLILALGAGMVLIRRRRAA